VNNEYPEVMKTEMKTSPAAEFYISGLSPESSLIKYFMRQVFWLNLNLVAFPWRDSRHSGKNYQDVYRITRDGYYSYGDSAGIKPDFPFNNVGLMAGR
jgi:hypothetical protein